MEITCTGYERSPYGVKRNTGLLIFNSVYLNSCIEGNQLGFACGFNIAMNKTNPAFR